MAVPPQVRKQSKTNVKKVKKIKIPNKYRDCKAFIAFSLSLLLLLLFYLPAQVQLWPHSAMLLHKHADQDAAALKPVAVVGFAVIYGFAVRCTSIGASLCYASFLVLSLFSLK